jgi:photosystem II stability/assembly factor-like uncharacterized protein
MSEPVRLYAATYDGVHVLQSTAQGWAEFGSGVPDVECESIAGAKNHPERVYVADLNGGLYGTEDAGQHWSKLLDGEVWSVAVDPNDEDVIYAGTQPIHLYRSEDRGKTWEDLTGVLDFPEEVTFNWWFPQPPHLGHVYNIFIHPDDSRTIYLCLEHGGIVRSFDRGATWEDVSEGLDYPDMHAIRALPGSRTRYFTSAARGFFASDDPAKGWTRSQNGCTRNYFHSFIFLAPPKPEQTPTMLVATADGSPGYWDRPEEARGAIFRSADAAQTWHRVGEGLPDEMPPMVNMLVNHPSDSRSAYAALGGFRRGANPVGTVMATRDRGDSWDDLGVTLEPIIGFWAAAD